MAARTRPDGCCAPVWVEPLPVGRLKRLSGAARALADPSRIEMLRLLAAQPGPVCACDIVDHFELSQSTVSHHLKILREARLVSATRRGLWMFYAIDRAGITAVEDLSGLAGRG